MQNIIAFVDTEDISDTAATSSASSIPTIALTPDDPSVHVLQSQASSLTEVSHSEPGASAGSVVSCTSVRKGKRKRKRVDCSDDDSDNIIKKLTIVQEKTMQMFLEHEREISEKEKEEDRQRCREDKEHELRLFSMLFSQFGGRSYPANGSSMHCQQEDATDTYSGLPYVFPRDLGN